MFFKWPRVIFSSINKPSIYINWCECIKSSSSRRKHLPGEIILIALFLNFAQAYAWTYEVCVHLANHQLCKMYLAYHVQGDF